LKSFEIYNEELRLLKVRHADGRTDMTACMK